MQALNELWIIYALVFTAALLGVQAIYWLFFRARRVSKAINRRLALSQELSSPATVLETVRRERGFADSDNPIVQNLSDQLTQTGLRLDKGAIVFSVGALVAILFLVFGFALGFGPAAFGLAITGAILAVVLFLRTARNRRIARFA